ncbi:hypothetical protein LJ656_10195 [Paraburkholderia sp. MMS20-SJTR3]|uniref:Uncharacterized protein n=1 Tax=Paraburkholderia sejongensis TaxID=2886946 RepID=A0ABS8JSX8_9BURK|nr:hypothetical protein [Paraburkholderia sp. MMS20-SJTR3]MCC8392958.1 hypothetical protein [Paraburkholderia sp. MMS20-SJTR3]
MVTIFEESGKAEVKERRGGSRCTASRRRGVKLHRAGARPLQHGGAGAAFMAAYCAPKQVRHVAEVTRPALTGP